MNVEERQIARQLLELEDRLTTNARNAFEEWLAKDIPLTTKQREWLFATAVRLGVADEPSKNLFSQMDPKKQAEQRKRAERVRLPWEKEEGEK